MTKEQLDHINHHIIPTGQEPWIDQGEYGKRTPVGVRKEVIIPQYKDSNIGGERWNTNYFGE